MSQGRRVANVPTALSALAALAALAALLTGASAPSAPSAIAGQVAGNPVASSGSSAGTLRSTRIDDVSSVGIFGPTAGIRVANLTVRPGDYIVSYTFEARLDSAYRASELHCGIVDNNGVKGFLAADPNAIRSGHDWERHSFATSFSLPDVTLGIRCFPARIGLTQASFRGVTLSVTKMPH